jgi:hypothetical protein
MAEEWAIYSADYGRVDWGDGYGLERDQAFGLNCRFVDEFRVKPDRPRKETTDRTVPPGSALYGYELDRPDGPDSEAGARP